MIDKMKVDLFCLTNKALNKLNLIFIYFERLYLDLREVLFQVDFAIKVEIKN